MNPSTTTDLAQSHIVANWETTSKGKYSEDQMIDAYLSGVDKGSTDAIKVLISKLNENLSELNSAIDKLVAQISDQLSIDKNKGIEVKLMIESVSRFRSLIIIDSDIESVMNDDIFNFIVECEESINDNNLSLQVDATVREGVNMNVVASDGYSLTYANTTAEA